MEKSMVEQRFTINRQVIDDFLVDNRIAGYPDGEQVVAAAKRYARLMLKSDFRLSTMDWRLLPNGDVEICCYGTTSESTCQSM
jgi:hypothetical protein